MTAATMIGLGFATAAFGLTPASLPLLVMEAGVCGFFLFGGIAGLYPTFAVSFTAEGRASGSGFVIRIGRIGSAVAPLIAGWLFASGFGVSATFDPCAVLGGLVLLTGGALSRPAQTSTPAT